MFLTFLGINLKEPLGEKDRKSEELSLNIDGESVEIM